MSDQGEHPSVYYDGRRCRIDGGSKLANPFASHTFHGAWFLAGWNDMDLELNRKIRSALQRTRRREQFNLPPSGLKEVPYGDDAARARREAQKERGQSRG